MFNILVMRDVNSIARTPVRYTLKVVVEWLVILVMVDNVLLGSLFVEQLETLVLQKYVVLRQKNFIVLNLVKLVVFMLVKTTVPQHLKATQMMMVMYVGKVVHLPMELVVRTLQLVTILVYVHLHLVVKLVVMKTKVVVYAKEVARTVKEMLVFLLVKTHVNMDVNQLVNRAVKTHVFLLVNQRVKKVVKQAVNKDVNQLVKKVV